MKMIRIVDPSTLVGKCCFNGSLFVKSITPDGKTVFSDHIPSNTDYDVYCVYRCTPSRAECFKSSIRITKIDLDNAKADIITNVPIYEDTAREDPRVFCIDDRIMISYSHVVDMHPKTLEIKIHGVICDHKFNKVQYVGFELNKKCKTQKNWTFFQNDGILHILYSVMPLEIYLWETDLTFTQTTEKHHNFIKRSWEHPNDSTLQLRGSCPPIRIGDMFYVFAHSTNYEVYCFTMDSNLFDVHCVTATPIITNRGKKLDIHFPCGAIYDICSRKFHLSMGVDDVQLGLFSISKHDLDAMMIPINNLSSVIFKHDKFAELMERQPKFCWINSYGGCGSDLLINFLKSKRISCYNKLWDMIGCHYPNNPEDIDTPTLYMIQDPRIALATMTRCNTAIANFIKLSNQLQGEFSMTSLLYFMLKQLRIWSKINKSNVIIMKEPLLRKNFHKLAVLFDVSGHIFSHYPPEDQYKSLDYDILNIHEDNILYNKFLKELQDLYDSIEILD